MLENPTIYINIQYEENFKYVPNMLLIYNKIFWEMFCKNITNVRNV